MGLACRIAAPTLIPRRSGDRVKTDRRDARELARMSLTGLLSPIWIPDPTQESLRDLARCRMTLKGQVSSAKSAYATSCFPEACIRHGEAPRGTNAIASGSGISSWRRPRAQIVLHCHVDVLEDLERRLVDVERDLAHEMDHSNLKLIVDDLRSLRGVDRVTAVTLLAEVGDLRRFPTAGAFMSYLGLTPSERSSGGLRRTGGITKMGNSILRRLLVESARTYRFPPRETKHLLRKGANASAFARDRSWAAQTDLCARYRKMAERGKGAKTITVAVARALAGYVWDIGRNAMDQLQAESAKAA